MSIFDERSGKYRYVGDERYAGMPFYIDMVGVDKCSPRYRIQRESSPLSVVGFVLQGAGRIEQGRQACMAREGSLFIVQSGESHVYYPVGEWEFCWANIKGDFWRQTLQRYGLGERIVFLDCPLGQEFYRLIEEAAGDGMSISDVQLSVQSFLMKLALQLYMEENLREENTLAARVKAEFARCSHTEQTQEEVCRRIGISVRHAQRLFRQVYGVSLHDFVAERKRAQARALLLHTDRSIRQIAGNVGFENEKYFSTFFRQGEGMSPTQYRRQFGYQREEDMEK